MKILVAVDAFKGTLSSFDINNMIKQHFVNSSHVFDYVMMADGGEGTVDALSHSIDGLKRSVTVSGPFGDPIQSHYVLSKDHSTAVIEVALSSGLSLIDNENLNPYKTSTTGLGQTIIDALDQGVTDIVVGIGGSSTNDGGAGMLQALGVQFYDQEEKEISFLTGQSISQVASVSLDSLDHRLKQVRFDIACDVNNPLLGPNGCAEMYARQKGASEEMVKALENNMKHFANIIESTLNIDIKHQQGTGAAGGLGFGFLALLNARLKTGFDLVAHATQLVDRIQEADLVITGEGQLDSQSFLGKVPINVAKIAKQYQKKVIGIFAISSLAEMPDVFDEIYTIVPSIASKKESLNAPLKTLKKLLGTIDLK